jgi:uncharacterized protein YhfF
MDPSIGQIWIAYLTGSGQPVTPPPPAWHFCDCQVDADNCETLVLSGRKRATTTSLWFFESRNLNLPAVGDLDIVTDWAGIARCIIRTTAVCIVPFCEIDLEYAAVEGEGDGSLEFWRAVHWAYYQRELSGTKYVPADDMPLVCQYFELVYPRV